MSAGEATSMLARQQPQTQAFPVQLHTVVWRATGMKEGTRHYGSRAGCTVWYPVWPKLSPRPRHRQGRQQQRQLQQQLSLWQTQSEELTKVLRTRRTTTTTWGKSTVGTCITNDIWTILSRTSLAGMSFFFKN